MAYPFQESEIAEDLPSQCDEYASEELLIHDRRSLVRVGDHVVNILDEGNVCRELPKIMDQGTMPTWAEE